jgi:anti-sigma factor RsiW
MACNEVQEALAWGRGLDEESQRHVLSCAACGRVAEELEELDARFRGAVEPIVPAGFADRVMAAIDELEVRPAPSGEVEPGSRRGAGRPAGRRGPRLLELAAALGAVGIATWNLVHFVLGVLEAMPT